MSTWRITLRHTPKSLHFTDQASFQLHETLILLIILLIEMNLYYLPQNLRSTGLGNGVVLRMESGSPVWPPENMELLENQISIFILPI